MTSPVMKKAGEGSSRRPTSRYLLQVQSYRNKLSDWLRGLVLIEKEASRLIFEEPERDLNVNYKWATMGKVATPSEHP